jgi:ribosomal protein L7/L12
MLRLVKFKCGCIGTSTVSGMSHLTTSCEEHRGDDHHPGGTFLLRDMKGQHRQAMSMTETGMELLSMKPEPKVLPPRAKVVEHLREMEDHPEYFRQTAYALSQLDSRAFADIADAVRDRFEGKMTLAKLLIARGENKIRVLKLIREVTGKDHGEASEIYERFKAEIH